MNDGQILAMLAQSFYATITCPSKARKISEPQQNNNSLQNYYMGREFHALG